MPERDDMPEHGPDPMDEAYVRAEQALDDEAARAARRARVLGAVASETAAPPVSAAPARRAFRRYGGWLAAAGVAGLSVWTAQQAYRLTPHQPAPAPVKAPAPSATPVAPPLSSMPPAASSAAPPVIARRRPPIAEPAPEAPPVEVAPPPPLPLPPVEKPIQAPPALAPAPPPPPPPAALAAPAPPPPPPPPAQPRATTDVVVSAQRIAPRAFPAQSPEMSAVLESEARAEAARLRAAAAAGHTADIEALLAQGMPVDAADENGETALMMSIRAGQRDAAALLHRHGASLDLKNRAGISARDMAVMKNDPELDRALGLLRRVTPSGATPP